MSSRFTVDNLLINNDMTTLGEVKGTKHSLIFSKEGSLAGAELKAGEVDTDSAHGVIMTRSGSITGFSMSYDAIVLYKGTSMKVYIFPDLVWTIFISSQVADNKSFTRKQARGTDTFAAGDYIFVSCRLVKGELDNAIITLEVIFDE